MGTRNDFGLRFAPANSPSQDRFVFLAEISTHTRIDPSEKLKAAKLTLYPKTRFLSRHRLWVVGENMGLAPFLLESDGRALTHNFRGPTGG